MWAAWAGGCAGPPCSGAVGPGLRGPERRRCHGISSVETHEGTEHAGDPADPTAKDTITPVQNPKPGAVVHRL